mgnify:CR=1 FL=1
MGSKVDRIGEKGINNFGSEVIIVEYRNRIDIDVYFPEYNWTFKKAKYGNFKRGTITCPYEKRVYGEGYIGEGDYTAWKNGKITKCYNTWHHMLRRCYDEKYHERQPTYIGCKVSERFLNFQNFGDWDNDNYYKVEGEIMCLDKDILVKHNKIYSPETCIYVPQTINNLFTKRQNGRGDEPIGVTYNKRDDEYRAQCNLFNIKSGKSKRKYLGSYDNPEEAFKTYKQFKEKYIKQVADYYKDKIPQRLYQALYNYEVEIDD